MGVIFTSSAICEPKYKRASFGMIVVLLHKIPKTSLKQLKQYKQYYYEVLSPSRRAIYRSGPN